MATLVEIIGNQQIRIIAQEDELRALRDVNASLRVQLEKLTPHTEVVETLELPNEEALNASASASQ